jgi:hypothetical protein
MFPSKLCGVWTLVASARPNLLGSEMDVNYNAVRFSLVKRVGLVTVKTNHYGSVYLLKEGNAKLAWSSKVNYVVETTFLPNVVIPSASGHKCRRVSLDFDVDESNSLLMVSQGTDNMIFRKKISTENSDSIAKLFLTQLVFDLIIRKIHDLNLPL